MKFGYVLLVFLFFLFFCTTILSGQIKEGAEFDGKLGVHPFAEISAAAAYDYDLLVAGGFELWQKHATTTFRTSIDTADQRSFRDGTTFRIEGNSYANVSRKIFVGSLFGTRNGLSGVQAILDEEC